MSDRLRENQKINEEDIICIIKTIVKGKHSEAYIFFKSCLSIDNDFKGVYNYLKEFLAIIKAKIRQTNSWGIKVKLYLMPLEEFDRLEKSFMDTKKHVIGKVWKRKNNKLH